MFDWFRRRPEPPKTRSSAKPQRPSRPAPLRHARGTEPPPVPEVVAEGSTEADWSAWEDSMTAWDSQLQGLDPKQRVQVRDTRPSQLEDADPFANVRRKGDR